MTQGVGCAWELQVPGSLFITYCDDAATSEQWLAYMKVMRGFKGRPTRFLVYADAVPPREVLADIASVARGEPWTVALISPSLAVRFAATTFSFVIKGFRFFPPEALDAALTHLGGDEAQKQQSLRLLARLSGQENPVLPKA